MKNCHADKAKTQKGKRTWKRKKPTIEELLKNIWKRKAAGIPVP
jgi:hypothetical protein